MHPALVKFFRYLVTGSTSAIVDVGVFAALHHAGVPTLTAAVLSFAMAATVNFQLASRFVFDARPTGRGFVLFVAVALVGLVVNAGVTVAAERLLGVPPVLAKIAGIGAAFGINFMLNLLVVFKDRGPGRH